MSARQVTRRSILGATAASFAVALTGCAEESTPPAVDPGPKPAQPLPVLNEDRIQNVLDELTSALKKADDARDASLLAPRISGSAAEFRKATYALISKVEEHESALQRPSATPIVPIASTNEGFPRSAVALVKDESADGLPFFVALTQKDARSPFTSWGWARQASGVDMPSVPGVEVGATEVPLDANDLAMAPAKALDLYTKILNDGHHNADPDDLILEDPFQQSVHKEIQTERDQINAGVEKDSVATVHETYRVKEGEHLGLRTAEAGAIVMATLASTRSLLVRSGTISYEEENLFTKVAGRKEFSKEILRNYGTTVILHIPSKDSGQKIQPIGAYKVLLSVTGS